MPAAERLSTPGSPAIHSQECRFPPTDRGGTTRGSRHYNTSGAEKYKFNRLSTNF